MAITPGPLPSTPNEISQKLESGRKFMERGDYALAIESLLHVCGCSDRDGINEFKSTAELLLIQCLLAAGEIARAEARLDALQESSLASPVTLAAVSVLCGWRSCLCGLYAEGLLELHHGVAQLNALGTDEWLAEAARWKAFAYRGMSNRDSAIESLYESLIVSKRRNDWANVVRARTGLARLYRVVGRYEEAQTLFRNCLEAYEQAGSSSMLIRAAIDLSIVSRLLGDYPSARSFAQRGLAISEENQEEVPILLSQIALARVDYEIGEFEEALTLRENSITRADDHNLFHPLVLGLEDRGDLAFNDRRYSDALSDYARAFELLQSANTGEYAGELAWRIGLTHLYLQDLTSAESWITRGLEICEKTGDAKELAVTIRSHGVLLLHQGDIEAGLRRIRESLDRHRKLGVPFEAARCHFELAKAAHLFTASQRDFETELENAEEVFEQIGAGLGLRWTRDLRQSVTWSKSTPPASTEECELLSESFLEIRPIETRSKTVRFAASTLGIDWRSSKYVEALEVLRHFARSNSPLLVTGETGVGKTAFAEIAHVLGSHSREPFVVVNCASLPETLLESELFGHIRGAFTGADRDRIGLIRSAGSGTIFLDEVDKASSSFQANLLHVLDRGEIRAVGSHTFQEIKARFVLATNRNLSVLAAEEKFLADLEYRISGLRIAVPSIKERMDDFDLLLALALRELRVSEGIEKEITVEARNFLASYDWPGNLRELFSVIRAAGLLARRGGPLAMPEILRVFEDSRRSTHVERTHRVGSLATRMEELEKDELLMVLRLEGGSQSRAAAKLGITRRGLNKKLHRLGLVDQLDREGLANFSRKRETTGPESSDNED